MAQSQKLRIDDMSKKLDFNTVREKGLQKFNNRPKNTANAGSRPPFLRFKEGQDIACTVENIRDGVNMRGEPTTFYDVADHDGNPWTLPTDNILRNLADIKATIGDELYIKFIGQETKKSDPSQKFNHYIVEVTNR